MRVVTLGELMLRLTPEGNRRFVQMDKLQAWFGGAEANVAVSLAGFGLESSFVTRLPAHEVGQAAINSLRAFGVDTSAIVRGGERVGIYYCEKGAGQRPDQVIYDRAGSSMATAGRSEFDFGKILCGADWFHFTGITPAISSSAAEITYDALAEAKKRGIPVSCDLNYRKKLWSAADAGRVMGKLLPYVDYLIVSPDAVADLFGIRAKDAKTREEEAVEVSALLTERFGFRGVAVTLRESLTSSDHNWSAMIYTGGQAFFSPKYAIHIVDRIGGGDAFAAGMIYALLTGEDGEGVVRFAAAAGCLKHSVEGDANLVSVSEVRALAGGDGTVRVQR